MSGEATGRLRPLVITALAGFAILAAGTWWWMRGPLAGDRSHDFGLVDVAPGGVELIHTFSLRNRTSRALTLSHISSSCGCSEARASREKIAGGETVEITATLSLKTHKRKHANIFLDLGPDGVVRLSIAGTGQAPAALPRD
jgi:hypothetical protein